MRSLPAILLATLSLAAACGEHDHDDPDAEACGHLRGGPAENVTASATPAATAPAVRSDHRRYDVALVDAGGGKGGSVSFASSAARDHVLYTDVAVPVRVATAAMMEIAPSASATETPACPEIKGRHVFRLGVGPHVITFGPTSADRVGLVIEPLAGH